MKWNKRDQIETKPQQSMQNKTEEYVKSYQRYQDYKFIRQTRVLST